MKFYPFTLQFLKIKSVYLHVFKPFQFNPVLLRFIPEYKIIALFFGIQRKSKGSKV